MSRGFFKGFTPSWDQYIRNPIDIRDIAVGTFHSLLLTKGGELFGCGANDTGQLGIGDFSNKDTWVKLSDKKDIRAIAAGRLHSLFLTDTGEFWGCGGNQGGQLGLGHNNDQNSWVKLSDKTDIRAIAVCGLFSLFLTPFSFLRENYWEEC